MPPPPLWLVVLLMSSCLIATAVFEAWVVFSARSALTVNSTQIPTPAPGRLQGPATMEFRLTLGDRWVVKSDVLPRLLALAAEHHEIQFAQPGPQMTDAQGRPFFHPFPDIPRRSRYLALNEKLPPGAVAGVTAVGWPCRVWMWESLRRSADTPTEYTSGPLWGGLGVLALLATLAGAAASAFLWYPVVLVRRSIRRGQDLCTHCGYPHPHPTSNDEHTRCPECGQMP